MLTEGKHVLSIESEKVPSIEINFELSPKLNNMNVKFDPSKF